MELDSVLYGGAPHLEKIQVAATVSDIGVPLTASTETDAGIALPTTTDVTDMVGLNVDTATFVTAQQTDGSSAERTVTVITNPAIFIEALLSGGATEGTQLILYDVTTASTDGLEVITGDDWSSPQFDDGAVWGFDGANAGQIRKITATNTTRATVTVAFDQDTAVGDNFLRAPFWPYDDQSDSITLTTNFTEVDASAAVTTGGAAFSIVRINAGDIGTEGRSKSSVILFPKDHWFNKLS